MSLVEHLLQLETIAMIDHWEGLSDVCCLRMTVLNCSIDHKLLKKAFRYVQKNTSLFKRGIDVKWFVNLVYYLEKLMHIWITGPEAWLIAIKEFIILYIFKKRVKDNFSKDLLQIGRSDIHFLKYFCHLFYELG